MPRYGIVEVIGSIPIGSTNHNKGLALAKPFQLPWLPYGYPAKSQRSVFDAGGGEGALWQDDDLRMRLAAGECAKPWSSASTALPSCHG